MNFKVLIVLIAFLSSLSMQSQVADSVSIGQGYISQTFYSLENGEVAMEDNINWDLAFSTELTGYAIRTNDGAGTLLYAYPNGDSSDWDNVDTIGVNSWTSFYNSDKTWNTGAFNQTENDLDVGWGDYNSITHVVTGDSLYVISLSNGDWKKLWIQELTTGVYTFKHANLDGSSEQEVSLSKFDYPGKNFAYYSIINNETYDLEPSTSTWDFVFTKYVSEVAPEFYYGVTGAISNKNVSVAEASEVDLNDINYWDFDFSEDMDVIGYDWKTFNNTTFQYEIADSLAYFVNDQEGNIWKMIMTGFSGSSEGKMYFTKELISSNSISNIEEGVTNFNVYPNPNSGNVVYVSYDSVDNNNVNITMIDITGKVISSTNEVANAGNNIYQFSSEGWANGIYIVQVQINNSIFSSKLIIE